MLTIHSAQTAEIDILIEFIQKKAEFDRQVGSFDGTLETTAERLNKALFGEPKFAYALLAKNDQDYVGFAFFHFHFSSFKSLPSLWLDDLYVDKKIRRSGAGLALMNSISSAAREHNCSHISWEADTNNTYGVPFYQKLGATQLSKHGTRLVYSITPKKLSNSIKKIQESSESM